MCIHVSTCKNIINIKTVINKQGHLKKPSFQIKNDFFCVCLPVFCAIYDVDTQRLHILTYKNIYEFVYQFTSAVSNMYNTFIYPYL